MAHLKQGLIWCLWQTSGSPRRASALFSCELHARNVQGSGKTLAFGLPILQVLHSEAPAVEADAGIMEAGTTAAEAMAHITGQRSGPEAARRPLRALILEPTRELAMQVGLLPSLLLLHAARSSDSASETSSVCVPALSAMKSITSCNPALYVLRDHQASYAAVAGQWNNTLSRSLQIRACAGLRAPAEARKGAGGVGPPHSWWHLPGRAAMSAQQLIADGVYLQVCEHLQRLAKPLGVWVAPIVGGISQAKQARLLGRQPQVKLLDHVKICQNCARCAIVSVRHPTREI